MDRFANNEPETEWKKEYSMLLKKKEVQKRLLAVEDPLSDLPILQRK
jgi:hypothetical protein